MFGSLSTYKIKYFFVRFQAAAHETTHLSQIYFKIDFLVFFLPFYEFDLIVLFLINLSNSLRCKEAACIQF